MNCEILYADKNLIVCVKPAGLLSENGGMPELLEKQLGGKVFCVHRLDKAVGGVMVYARSAEAAAFLSREIAERRMDKKYLAVCEGCPVPERGLFTDLLYHDQGKNKSYVVDRERRGVKKAELTYALVENGENFSLVRVELHTGRSHQIRAQFASRKMPLVNDGRYGSKYRNGEIALWSESLKFRCPVSGECMEFSCTPPESWPWNEFGKQEE